MKSLILFHDADNDGFFSASILYKYLLDKGVDPHTIDLQPTNYTDLGKLTDDDIESWRKKYTHLFMLDVSFNQWERMEKVFETFGNSFVWFDHHKPIINESSKHKFGNAKGSRDTRYATILNVFYYLYDNLNISATAPLIFRVLDAFDNWTYTTSHLCYKPSGSNQHNIQSVDYTYINEGASVLLGLDFQTILAYVSQVIDTFLKNGDIYGGYDEMMSMLDTGSVCLDYDKDEFAKSLDMYGDGNFTVNGRKALFIVSSRHSSSILFEKHANEYKNGIVAKRKPSGEWEFSVYNTKPEYDDEINLGEYLKTTYGKGGGHAGAAGITFTEEEFVNILTAKKI